MKAYWLRSILALLLLATAAAKFQGTANIDQDMLATNILQVLAEHRPDAQAEIPLRRTLLPVAVEFHASECSGPIEVIPIDINLQEAPLFDVFIRPDYRRHFVYLDKTWTAADRLQMRLTWLRHKAPAMLGLGRFVTITKGLLVASPPGCQAAAAIDWSAVWTRSTPTAGARPAG
jgi:hypothetical protein